MFTRKVYEMGRGTLLVSLPKEWVKRYNIKKGQELNLQISEDGSLTISPLEGIKDTKEAIINYPLSKPEKLENLILAYYLFGYDYIKLIGNKKIEYKDRKAIKDLLSKLIGLEIIEEDAYNLSLQFLPDPSYLDPYKILRRMNLLVQGMYKDAILSALEGDYDTTKSIIERDDEVDRLYFLLIRIVRSAMMNPRIVQKFGLRLIDCLDYRLGAKLLEGIGDASCDLADALLRMDRKVLLEENKDALIYIINRFKEIQDVVINSFPKREGVSISFPLEVKDKIEKIKINFLKDISSIAFINALERIFNLILDIADLSTPLYPLIK